MGQTGRRSKHNEKRDSNGQARKKRRERPVAAEAQA